MRVALLTYSTKPRGGVIHTMELAEALDRRGLSVCIFALNKDGGNFCRPLTCNYRLVPTKPPPQTIDGVVEQRIQEYVNYFSQHEDDYDIYHAQDCISANALVRLRSQGYSIPYILRTVHHIDNYTSPYLQTCQEKSILLSDRCICVSRYWQQELQRLYKIDAPVVFNGVNAQRFSALKEGSENSLKKHLGIVGHPIFLNIGGVEPRKNSIRILQAFAQVLPEFPQAQLIIAGGLTLFDYSDYQDRFFAEVKRLGIEEGKALLLPGAIGDRDLPVLYRCADAFIFPSVKEGWGLVVMEAIASGLPVVTSDQPPFIEFLTREQALLVDAEQVNEIAIAMKRSIDPETRKSLIQNSRSILSRYTWDNSAQMHWKYYQTLLSGNDF
ncbi:MSMEG_0565 family glycosyltransferase [Roseofilum reptotaenium CS-1145]|uniref:Glycosyl transferase family 1 n=1 Tax=Roseofilum reptotaenium AO1-A TaxID=1925591 RepID=A0A1L9QQD7_9CYAN|nr:MSMEG_0565 family glycosyltransferase [Roseofilum reptotaenium]MDB9519075.1 MSMEG_0565 family glycosyltransferase [Roseofilum reptotaenium CS-1145]OJJ24859.1 glycosyl transferase family 1 [Roseofilum reptotaenium AO1-A]